MIILPLALSLSLVGSPATGGAVYSGVENRLRVAIPRLDARVEIDGALDEPVWRQAAVLTGFSEYAPVDGRPAENETEVLVWYSPVAIYFGIRAHAEPGTVHATLANRDNIESDDFIQIYISTFNDGRQALMFGVNPLGIQEDGALSEGSPQTGGGYGSGLSSSRQAADLSPDYVYESKGRLTEFGYEVEIRIPFKSLRYQAGDSQNWGLHIIRRVQSNGHEHSWVPAKRAGVSFLMQAGTLEGLTDLRRGLALDVNPVVTDNVDGTRRPDREWRYRAEAPQFGGNVRWGATPNLTFNGTINPDFSQVEADQAQFRVDPRQALYFVEKRPFFLEGIEQFATENRLIYTRRIVSPSVAAKLTGKISGMNVAILSAIDDPATSATGHDSPFANMIRIQHDLPGRSKAAVVYTNRLDGDNANHVIAADARLTIGNLYTWVVQAGESTTRRNGTTTTAPIWESIFSRNGRTFGLKYALTGTHPNFVAADGFIPRTGIVTGSMDHQITVYGSSGAFIQSFSSDVSLNYTWQYLRFVAGQDAQDKKLHFNNNVTLRGGWQAGGAFVVESYGFDQNLYANYRLGFQGSDGLQWLPFIGVAHLQNVDWTMSLKTPQFASFDASVSGWGGYDENFYEWAPASVVNMSFAANVRLTPQIRLNATYSIQNYVRRTDGSTVGRRQVPRVKLEYQLTRSIFVRLVGQYTSAWQDDLRDDSRTNLPIYIYNPATGVAAPALGSKAETFQTNWLFSYQPTPGTVVFAGYNNALATPSGVRLAPVQRSTDGFFLKVSYLYRLK